MKILGYICLRSFEKKNRIKMYDIELKEFEREFRKEMLQTFTSLEKIGVLKNNCFYF